MARLGSGVGDPYVGEGAACIWGAQNQTNWSKLV